MKLVLVLVGLCVCIYAAPGTSTHSTSTGRYIHRYDGCPKGYKVDYAGKCREIATRRLSGSSRSDGDDESFPHNPTPEYFMIIKKTCADFKAESVADADTCDAAAEYLGVQITSPVTSVETSEKPSGCVYEQGKKKMTFNTDASATTKATVGKISVCKPGTSTNSTSTHRYIHRYDDCPKGYKVDYAGKCREIAERKGDDESFPDNPTPEYFMIIKKTCADFKADAVADADTCDAAAEYLGVQITSPVTSVETSEKPSGCVYEQGQKKMTFNTDASATTKATVGKISVCKPAE